MSSNSLMFLRTISERESGQFIHKSHFDVSSAHRIRGSIYSIHKFIRVEWDRIASFEFEKSSAVRTIKNKFAKSAEWLGVLSGARVQIELNDFSIDIYDFGFGSKLKRNIFDDAIHARNMNIPLFRNEQFRYTLNATISMLIRDQINILFAGFCFSRNDVLMNTNPIHSTHANTHTAPTSICMQNVKDTTLCEQQRQQWVNKCQHTI